MQPGGYSGTRRRAPERRGSGEYAMDHWTKYLDAIARADQPTAVFDALCRIVEDTVGTKLFTVMTHDPASGMSRRIYSSDEASYPTGGYKPLRPTLFSKTALDERKPFSALTIEGIAEVFADHPLILSLGCESCCNIPIVIGDEVAGTLNLLHEKGYYGPERVEQAMALRPYAIPAFLLARISETKAGGAGHGR